MTQQNVDFGINLGLTGEGQVATGLGKAAAATAEFERSTVGLNSAQAALAVATQKSQAAQEAYNKALAAGPVQANALAAAQAKVAQAQAAQAAAALKVKDAQAQLERQTQKLGGAAALTGQQTAQLSAQLQDLFVQIQAGGNPLTALLQQGSQLSAVFGGAGNALRAVASIVTPTAAAYGVLAAAAGAVAYGLVAGKTEAADLARTLAITGNAAGLTQARFDAMAQSIAQATNTSIGSARDTLQQLAASGQLSGDALLQTAEAVQRFAKATGQSGEDVSKQFVGLIGNVTKGAAELNKTYNFLTAAQFDTIKSLDQTGQEAQALALVMEALNRRIGDQEQNLGPLTRLWSTFTRAMSEANQAAKGIGKDATASEQIAALQRQIAQNEAAANSNAGRRRATIEQQNDVLRAQIELLQGVAEKEDAAAKAAAQRASANAAGIKLSGIEDQFKTPAAKLKEATDQVRNLGEQAGKTEAEISRLVGTVVAYSQANALAVAAGQARLSAAATVDAAKLAGVIDRIQAQRTQGLLNEYQAIDAIAKAEADASRAEETRLRKAIDLSRALPNNDAATIQLQGQLQAQTLKTAQIEAKAADDIAAAKKRRVDAANATYEAEREANRAAQDAARAAADAAYYKAAADVQTYADSVADAAYALTIEQQAMQVGEREREIMLGQLRVELDLRQRVRAIRASGLSAERQDELIGKLTGSASTAAQQVVDRVTGDFQSRGAQLIRDSATDALSDAFKAGFDDGDNYIDAFADRLGKNVRAKLIDALSEFAAVSIISAITGSQQGTQSPGYLQTASTLSSLYSSASKGYAWMTGGSSAAAAGASANAAAYSNGANLMFAGDASAAAGGSTAAGGSAAGASSWGSAATVGWIAAAVIAALAVSSNAYSKGYTSQNLDSKFWESPFSGEITNASARLFTSLGIGSEKANQIFSGAAGFNYLFGRGATRLDEQGVSGTITGGDFSGQAYANFRQPGGLFRSDKKWTEVAAVPDELGRFLDTAASTVFAKAKDFGAALGLPAQQLASVTTDLKVALVSPENDTQAAIDAAAQKNIETIGGALDTYAQALVAGYADAVKPLAQYGETTAQTIERVGAAIVGVNDVLGALGLTALQASIDGGKAAVSLQDLFGGLATLQQAAGSYLQNYYSDSERAALTTQALSDSLADVNLQLPATRDQFRALVEAQDLTTESGRNAFAVLMGVSEAFAAITPAARSAADILQERQGLERQLMQAMGDTAGLRAAELEKLDPSNRALQQRIYALQDEAAILAQRQGLERELLQLQGNTAALRELERAALDPSNRALYDQIQALEDQQAAADKAADALQRMNDSMASAVEAARGGVQAAYEAVAQQIESAKQSADADAKKRIADIEREADTQTRALESQAQKIQSTFTSLLDSLTGNIRKLSGDIAGDGGRSEAMSLLRTALGDLRSGRPVDLDAIRTAAGTVSNLGTEGFGSRLDYQRALAGAANLLREVSGAARGRMSAEMAAIAAQQVAIEAAADEQVKAIEAARDAQLGALDSQLAEARAAAASLVSIDDGVQTLAQALERLGVAIGAAGLLQGKGGPTGQILTSGNQQVYASAAGAVATRPEGGGWADTLIRGKSGAMTTADVLRKAINDLVAMDGWARIVEVALSEGIDSNMVDAIMDWKTGTALAAAKLRGLPSFASGSAYLPHDMVAKVHEGERIVPAADNAMLTRAVVSGLGGGGAATELRQLRQNAERMSVLLTSIADNASRIAASTDRLDRAVDAAIEGDEVIHIRTVA